MLTAAVLFLTLGLKQKVIKFIISKLKRYWLTESLIYQWASWGLWFNMHCRTNLEVCTVYFISWCLIRCDVCDTDMLLKETTWLTAWNCGYCRATIKVSIFSPMTWFDLKMRRAIFVFQCRLIFQKFGNNNKISWNELEHQVFAE